MSEKDLEDLDDEIIVCNMIEAIEKQNEFISELQKDLKSLKTDIYITSTVIIAIILALKIYN